MDGNNINVQIDYLSATFPLELDYHEHEVDKANALAKKVAKYLNCEKQYRQLEYALNNFKFEYQIGDFIELRVSGPKNKLDKRTCQLELKGEGCREFERKNPDKTWVQLIFWLYRRKATFRRIDIAIDDLSGNIITMDYLLKKIEKEHYTSIFTDEPVPHGTKKSGMTIQFGSRKSNSELCIYDKLKERLKRKKEVPPDITFWMRYEMRFKGENAQSVVNALCTKYESNKKDDKVGICLQKFAFEQLYRILDIKKENKASLENQKTVDTDPLWLLFLQDVRKGKLQSVESPETTYIEYFNHIERQLSLYVLLKYMQTNKDLNLFLIEILKVLINYKDFNKPKFAKMNKFLRQLKKEPLTDSDFDNLIDSIQLITEEMELPF